MPKFQVKAPDGQLFEFNGPEGATQAQAEEYFRQNYKPSQQASQQVSQPAGLAEAMQNPAYQEQGRSAAGMRSFLNEATLGLGRDAVAAFRAAPALFTGSKDFLPEYERQAAFEKAQLAGGEKEYPATTALSGLAGGVGTSIALTPARVAGWINKSAPFLERAAKYALVSAPVEAFRATQNLQEGETVPQAVGRGLETAAIAGPLGATLEKGVGAVANVGRALVGGAKKGPITEAEKVIQAGKEANIPIRTTDVIPPQSWLGKRLQQATDRIPVIGTGGGLVKTQEARRKATEDFVNQYVPEAQADPVWLKEISEEVKTKHGEKFKTFKEMKNTVLSKPEYNTNILKENSLSQREKQIQKDIASLQDSLSNGQTRNYADLLQEELDPVYQIARRGVNIDNYEEFKFLLDGATQKMPSVKQPTTLLTRIRQLGGIKSTDYNKGDIKAMDINVRGKTKRSISPEGTLQVTNKPKSLDYMRESLVEEGWLKPDATINDLLDAMNVDEMARNTGIGHIYNPKDASKGLEYENSLQYVSGASEARDNLYFNYGIENPEAFKKEILKDTEKARKELERYQKKQSVGKTLSQEEKNRLLGELTLKNKQLNDVVRQKNSIAGQKKSIPVSNVSKTIDDLIEEYKPLAAENDLQAMEIVSKLENQKNVFLKNNGLKYLETKRKLLSDLFPSGTSKKVTDTIKPIYSALNEDIGNFLKSQNPADYKKWKSGNEGLTILGDETKRTSLSRVINKGNVVPEAAKSLILSSKPSEVANINRYLKPAGRENAKKVIVEDLITRSTPKDSTFIDPDKFLQVVSQRQNQFKTFFSKQEQDALEGLTRALRVTTEAGKYEKSRPWLQTLVSSAPFLGIGVGVSTKAAAGAAAITGVGGRIYQSKPVRDTLIALGRVKANSTAEQRLLDKLISLQAGQATAREITGEE